MEVSICGYTENKDKKEARVFMDVFKNIYFTVSNPDNRKKKYIDKNRLNRIAKKEKVWFKYNHGYRFNYRGIELPIDICDKEDDTSYINFKEFSQSHTDTKSINDYVGYSRLTADLLYVKRKKKPSCLVIWCDTKLLGYFNEDTIVYDRYIGGISFKLLIPLEDVKDVSINNTFDLKLAKIRKTSDFRIYSDLWKGENIDTIFYCKRVRIDLDSGNIIFLLDKERMDIDYGVT